MAQVPAFRKTITGASANNHFVALQDAVGEANEKPVVDYANAAYDLGSSNIASIVIDGTTYTFTTQASTQALLKTGLYEAFASAGYKEVVGTAVAITGAASATVVTINTTATLEKMVNAAAADIAFAVV